MKAIVQTGYGSADVFDLRDIEKPVIKDNEILIKVHAVALNSGDYYTMRGVPYMVRFFAGWPKPKNYVPGMDVAGQVEAVGKNVERFQAGDEVFGAYHAGCAEYVAAKESKFVPLPANLTHQQAAAVPTAGFTAYKGLHNVGKVQSGQKVLINGSSGGVGTFAVQIAKALGAEVTAVCSTHSIEMVRSIGADHIVDYTQEDFTQGGPLYDLILDQVANHPLAACRRALTPHGKHIPNSGESGLGYVLKANVLSMFVGQQSGTYFGEPNVEGLVALKELIESGKVTPVIDSTYTLRETPEAFRYFNEGHAQGKVVITLEDINKT
jgi:NADPH:quinone reductase-like Zn-dependent oxidoreductase